MFQFSGLTSDIIGYSIARVGCPIRIFTDQRLFAPPRNFSQLITSFFVSESQGIPRTPLLTFFYLLYLQVNLVIFYFYLFFPNMSKNFITRLFTSRLPNRLSFCFQIVWVKRGYYRIRTDSICATAYPCLKSFKFKVSSFKFVSTRKFPLFYYSPSNKLYERCVVLPLIVCLFVLIFLFSLLNCRTAVLSSIRTLVFWWRIRESNPWPSACKADALANWANPPGLIDLLFFHLLLTI